MTPLESSQCSQWGSKQVPDTAIYRFSATIDRGKKGIDGSGFSAAADLSHCRWKLTVILENCLDCAELAFLSWINGRIQEKNVLPLVLDRENMLHSSNLVEASFYCSLRINSSLRITCCFICNLCSALIAEPLKTLIHKESLRSCQFIPFRSSLLSQNCVLNFY